ncbi:Uncharacterised protein [Mycobacteroides abscessus subsp. abscessus]|nr:Uncharacterised protein [Mycobacteroides abscessus subsp. abscessus]
MAASSGWTGDSISPAVIRRAASAASNARPPTYPSTGSS